MNLRVLNKSGYPLVKATPGAIGYDLHASISSDDRVIQPLQRFRFDTGISIELPHGYGALVQPRSGLALHDGVYALTGVIDQDYRGPISVVLINLGRDSYKVLRGDRIAQLVIVRVDDLVVDEVDTLTLTDRGHSGFGSTGR